MNYNDLLHIPLQQARLLCGENGMVLRVTRKDGNSLIGTMDYRNDRVNVWIENEKVVKIVGVG